MQCLGIDVLVSMGSEGHDGGDAHSTILNPRSQFQSDSVIGSRRTTSGDGNSIGDWLNTLIDDLITLITRSNISFTAPFYVATNKFVGLPSPILMEGKAHIVLESSF